MTKWKRLTRKNVKEPNTTNSKLKEAIHIYHEGLKAIQEESEQKLYCGAFMITSLVSIMKS